MFVYIILKEEEEDGAEKNELGKKKISERAKSRILMYRLTIRVLLFFLSSPPYESHQMTFRVEYKLSILYRRPVTSSATDLAVKVAAKTLQNGQETIVSATAVLCQKCCVASKRTESNTFSVDVVMSHGT